jgi:hypothetical protein
MKVELVLILVVVSFLVGCATNGKGLPAQIPQALNGACQLFQKAKPMVVAAREYCKAHWNDKVPGTDRDLIPEDVKKTLREMDALLPQLDTAGDALCAGAEAMTAFVGADGKHVSADQVLDVVLRGVAIAIDLKGKGVI